MKTALVLYHKFNTQGLFHNKSRFLLWSAPLNHFLFFNWKVWLFEPDRSLHPTHALQEYFNSPGSNILFSSIRRGRFTKTKKWNITSASHSYPNHDLIQIEQKSMHLSHLCVRWGMFWFKKNKKISLHQTEMSITRYW